MTEEPQSNPHFSLSPAQVRALREPQVRRNTVKSAAFPTSHVLNAGGASHIHGASPAAQDGKAAQRRFGV